MLLSLLLACRDPSEPTRVLVDAVGTPAESAVVWGGFSQVWGYNHRINSLGDHVGPLVCDDGGCAAEIVHAAASGSGSDTATWSSRYTTVEAPGVTFLGGTTRVAIDLDEGEGEVVNVTADVILPGGPMGAELHALLNGFDLQATDDPDKLEHLTVAVRAPEVDGGDVRIPLDVALELDCDSVECDGTFQTDESVHYEVLVSWLLVSGGDADLAVTPAAAENAYAWANRSLDDELRFSDLTVSGEVRGERGFDHGLVGVTSLSVDLDDEHHMAEWSTAVSPGRYDPQAGALPFDATLAFKQWNAGTWWNPVSYTSPGSAAVAMDLALVQLRDACVRAGSVSGAIEWAADGGPASEAAVDTRTVAPGGC